jgi:hypothetical protein
MTVLGLRAAANPVEVNCILTLLNRAGVLAQLMQMRTESATMKMKIDVFSLSMVPHVVQICILPYTT